MDAVHDAKRLEELRALPLERKIQISQTHFNPLAPHGARRNRRTVLTGQMRESETEPG